MPRLTKSQQKRLVIDAHKKIGKLYRSIWITDNVVVSTKDMEAIDKLCQQWTKRIG